MALDNPLAEAIWSSKYRFAPLGGGGDGTVGQTQERVAAALAANEAPELRPALRERFLQALEDYRFLPAGRILAGAGTRRAVTLFNCFVMGKVPDDLGGIFEQVREAAVTLQQGGGVGMADIGSVRSPRR